MNTLYSTLASRVRACLKGTTTTYPDELVLDGINSALKAIMPWLPNRQVTVIQVTSGSIIELPEKTYFVDAIFDAEHNAFLPNFLINHGVLPETRFPFWVEYPNGYIILTDDSLDGSNLSVYHSISWDEIPATPGDDVVVGTPPYADLALVYYACSYCLGAAATSTAQLRQFNTRIDSGNPEDNPLKEMSSLMLQRFLNEVKMFPVVEKAIR